jgi:hypothetical protein
MSLLPTRERRSCFPYQPRSQPEIGIGQRADGQGNEAPVWRMPRHWSDRSSVNSLNTADDPFIMQLLVEHDHGAPSGGE